MFKSVAGKLIFRMVIGAIVALIIGLLAVLQFKQQMLNENAITLLKAKDSLLQQSFHEKMNTGSASLFSALAIMPELSELFVNKDHAALRVYLGNLPKVFKQETEFKNIRLNAFDADGNILMRTAATEPDSERGKSALHRSGFKKVLSGEVSHFEGLDFSRAGVSLVSVVSVKNKAGKVVGLLEFQSGFGSVVDTMVNQHAIYMVQLLNQEVLELYTKGKENPQLGGYYLAHPMQYETSRTWYQSLDIEQVMRQGFSIQNDKAVTLSPMISSDGKQIGYRLVGMDLAHPELQLIAHNIDVVIESMMLLLVVMLAILMVLLTGLVNRIVTKPLQHVGEGLSKVSQTGKLNLTIDYHADDEVGSMVSDLERVFNQVASALLEANQVVSAVAHGDFSRRVETALIGDLAELKSGVNASAEKVSFMMDELSKVMQGLAQGNFAVTMDERVAPAFREQVDAAMKSVSVVIADVNHVMGRMQHGYLDSRVSVSCQGGLLQLKERMNRTLDALGGSMVDIQGVMVAQTVGDIERMPKVDQKGDLGMMQNAMVLSMTNIASIITEVRTNLDLAVHGVNMMNHAITDISGQMQEQAAALEQSSATAVQMQEQTQTTQMQANEVASVMDQMLQHVLTTRQVMSGTIHAMQTIQAKSQQIESIVGLIDGIAFQTNLLALNAAVEAARAGEHGRGFAVVAGEVRSLAQKTADAAKDIKVLIGSTVEDVMRGNEQVKQTESAVALVESGAHDVQQKISVMKQSTQHTATGVGELSRAIKVLDDAIQQNTAGIEEISHTADNISEQSTAVLDSLSFFKTSNLGGLLDVAVAANDFRYARGRRMMRTWGLRTEVALLSALGKPPESTGLTEHFSTIPDLGSHYSAISQKKETAVAIAERLFKRKQQGEAISDEDFGELRAAIKEAVEAITLAEKLMLSGSGQGQRRQLALTNGNF